MKQLIINADDFGMSYEINEGIKKGINAGIINSVSVMANMPYFDDAVKFLKSKPEISVGLHFNITEGQPIGQPNEKSTLLREDNSFFHWTNLSYKLLTNKCSIEEIRDALVNQYEKLEKTGLKISHIDSHHHVHLYPSIYKIVLNYAYAKKIRFLRSRSFKLWSITDSIGRRLSGRKLIIFILCQINNTLFYKDNKHILKISSIYDMMWDNPISMETFKRNITHLHDGITEIICHPAIASKTGNPIFLKPRQKILAILLDKSLKGYLRRNNVELYKRNGDGHK